MLVAGRDRPGILGLTFHLAELVADLTCSDLVLVGLLRTDTWQTRRGGIEYNLTFLRQGVRRIMMEVDG